MESQRIFPPDMASILDRVRSVQPVMYGQTRNYTDGHVTALSPYISRGVISTRLVMDSILGQGYSSRDALSLIRELAWRDYFQEVWLALGEDINKDIRREQPNVRTGLIPEAVMNAKTGIQALDQGILELQTTGYMHNHLRMYTASLACVFGGAHWIQPARWMYYWLLDADWASNACSWQWVSGAFSNKQYLMNQENINQFTKTIQKDTFLDTSYDRLFPERVPEILQPTASFEEYTALPDTPQISLDPALPTVVYTFYNLDPHWHQHEKCNRVLLLEPSFFRKYPVCGRTIRFVLELSQNIPGIQILTAEWTTLEGMMSNAPVYFRKHPAFGHFRGIAEDPERMFPEVRGFFPSFFSFWKRCEKYLA